MLVVDDVLGNRRLLLHLLRRRYPSCHFAEAVNGMDVVTVFAHGPAAFDVVMMDGSMPIMDGPTATRALRARFTPAQLLIVGCTGNALAEE